MPCIAPIVAVQRAPGEPVSLGIKVREDLLSADGDYLLETAQLLLPCGSCVGCQISRARSWAIRCSLELQLHRSASFLTLTYSDKYCPPTLSRGRNGDLSRFMRYLRRQVGAFRFFGCGEYGELRERPHYHAILFGTADRSAAERAWGKGYVQMSEVTPGRIAYTAGYCAKKLGFYRPRGEEIDYSTGEAYVFEPPFLQMSRRPGIGGWARKFPRSWRSSAIWQGREFPVPRFLHASWRESASESELAALELEKLEARMRPTVRELDARRDIAHSRIRLRTERSQL